MKNDVPKAIECEMAVLGSIILEPKVLGEAQAILPDASAFYAEPHAAIYSAILLVASKCAAFDILQIHEQLRTAGILEEVGGPDYLQSLAEQVPSPANVAYYARIVLDKHRLRKLLDAAATIKHNVLTKENAIEGSDPLVDEAERLIFDVSSERQINEATALVDTLHERMDQFEQDGVPGLPTGFDALDSVMGGMHAGEMVVLAARPSIGKTALALNIAANVAEGGVGALVFSMEMSKQAIAERFLSYGSGVDSYSIRRRKFVDGDMRAMLHYVGGTRGTPLYIDDKPGLSITQLRTLARRHCAKWKIGLIVVDYLQLMVDPTSGRDGRQNEVSSISRGIKALARDLRIPILCLSQLNRAAEAREGHRPKLGDLRESGAIEQDADAVLLLHREEQYHIGDDDWITNNPNAVGLAELVVAKNRNGRTGGVELSWNAKTTTFRTKI